MGFIRWANSPWGGAALFFIAFVESSFFPIPPDVLLIALALGAPKKAFKYATISTIGSVAGAVLGYVIGNISWLTSTGEFTSFANFFFENIPGFTHEIYYNIAEMYKEHDFWIVFTAGFTPIPYKVITITSGVFSIDLIMFIIASIVSRGARFFLISALIWHFGAPIKSFIDKYFNLLAIVFTILLIGSFFLVKLI